MRQDQVAADMLTAGNGPLRSPYSSVQGFNLSMT